MGRHSLALPSDRSDWRIDIAATRLCAQAPRILRNAVDPGNDTRV